jgi:hypothetical protein
MDENQKFTTNRVIGKIPFFAMGKWVAWFWLFVVVAVIGFGVYEILLKYPDEIAAVTPQDIRDAARRVIDFDKSARTSRNCAIPPVAVATTCHLVLPTRRVYALENRPKGSLGPNQASVLLSTQVALGRLRLGILPQP